MSQGKINDRRDDIRHIEARSARDDDGRTVDEGSLGAYELEETALDDVPYVWT